MKERGARKRAATLSERCSHVIVSAERCWIYASYGRRDGRGQIGYHPLLLTRLLLYGYAVGVASSRGIDRHPDHDTISSFRQQHLSTLAGLFTQALHLCRMAGLVKLGHVAIDGSKLQANASKHKAMS